MWEFCALDSLIYIDNTFINNYSTIINSTRMNNRFTNFATVVGNVSQLIVAGSILAELYMKFRDRKKSHQLNPDDGGGLSPSPQQTPLAA